MSWLAADAGPHPTLAGLGDHLARVVRGTRRIGPPSLFAQQEETLEQPSRLKIPELAVVVASIGSEAGLRHQFGNSGAEIP